MFPKCKKPVCLALSLFVLLAVFAYKVDDRAPAASLQWIKDCISCRFNASVEKQKLRKWDLNVSPDGFLRLKKHFLSGKQEYFSFNLQRFKDLSYLGTSESGEIVIETLTDDIIVQTYNDPKGNIDSMARKLKIPVVQIEPEQLDSLRNNIKGLNQ